MGLLDSIRGAVREVAHDLGLNSEEGPANASRPDPSLDVAISVPTSDQPPVDNTINVTCLGSHAGQSYCGPQSSEVATYVGVMSGRNASPSDIASGIARGDHMGLEVKRAADSLKQTGVNFSAGHNAQLSVRGGYETSARLHAVSANVSIDDIRRATPQGRVFVGVASDNHGQRYVITMSVPEFSDQRSHIIGPNGIEGVRFSDGTSGPLTLGAARPVHTGTVSDPRVITRVRYSGNPNDVVRIDTNPVR